MKKDTVINHQLLLQLIPQKEPFVMVSELYKANENEAFTGFSILSGNILNHNDHFSEAGLIEHMAQSVALQGGYLAYQAKETEPKIGYIGAIKTAKIHHLPQIGEKIFTQVSLIQEFIGIKLSKIEVRDEEEKLIASAEIKTAIAPS